MICLSLHHLDCTIQAVIGQGFGLGLNRRAYYWRAGQALKNSAEDKGVVAPSLPPPLRTYEMGRLQQVVQLGFLAGI